MAEALTTAPPAPSEHSTLDEPTESLSTVPAEKETLSPNTDASPSKELQSPKEGSPTKPSTPKPLTIKQLRSYPPSTRSLALPDSTLSGQIQVGATRGRAFWLNYKLYGTGPVRIVWMCGHGDTIRAWRRFMGVFGAERYV